MVLHGSLYSQKMASVSVDDYKKVDPFWKWIQSNNNVGFKLLILPPPLACAHPIRRQKHSLTVCMGISKRDLRSSWYSDCSCRRQSLAKTGFIVMGLRGGDSIALKKGLKKGPKKGPKVNLLQVYA